MRWFILANGEAKRWNNYLGVDWEDETDDMDYPIDYHRWMKNVKEIDV